MMRRALVSAILHVVGLGLVAVWIWRRRPELVVIELNPLPPGVADRMWAKYSAQVWRTLGVAPIRPRRGNDD